MNFPFYIARRYLFAKKSTNAINVISAISVVGVAVATMAMIIVLSVFNGFSSLVGSLFTHFDPQLKVIPVEGKTVAADDTMLVAIRQMPEVLVATDCVEDMALAVYEGKQQMVTIMGVDDNFRKQTQIDAILYGDGTFELHDGDMQYGIPGIKLAQDIGMLANWGGWLAIYAPTREGQLDMSNPQGGFSVDSLLSPGCVFAVNQNKYDGAYIITSTAFARRLFDQQGCVSSLLLKLKEPRQTDAVKKKIRTMTQGRFRVLDRYEQQADTFRIMQIEKLLAYIFLTFILIVASFNIIGSLSMLIIDKKDDVATLRNLGADDRQIRQIFLLEGRMIAALGAIVGIALGLLLCWLQQTFGLVGMGAESGMFVVNAYPVSVHYSDVLIVFLTVIAVSWLAVWYPVRYISRKIL